MGLSVAITGSIILFTLLAVLFTISTMVNSLISVNDVSSQASILEDSISQTSTQIKSLSASSGEDYVQFSLANNGTGKLWAYDDFTVLITYDANIGGTKTKVTEEFTYDSLNSFQTSTVYLTPISELTGGWDGETGCAVNNGWLCIDEILDPLASDDADYITENNVNNNDQIAVEFELSDEVMPTIVTDVIVHYTYSENGDSGITDPDLDITLLEGVATIATWTELGQLPNFPAFGVAAQSLTPAEIATIGVYDDLSLEFNVNCRNPGNCDTGGGSLEDVHVSWGIVEVQGINAGASTTWVINNISNDIIDPQIINNEESANMVARLSYPIFANGDVIVSISTDRGVTSSSAITTS